MRAFLQMTLTCIGKFKRISTLKILLKKDYTKKAAKKLPFEYNLFSSKILGVLIRLKLPMQVKVI